MESLARGFVCISSIKNIEDYIVTFESYLEPEEISLTAQCVSMDVYCLSFTNNAYPE